MGVTLSTMTRVVDLLVRDGYIKRNNNPSDRREVWVGLTSKGKAMYVKLARCSQNYTEDILEQIPEKDRKALMKSLRLLNFAIDKVKRGCCPG